MYINLEVSLVRQGGLLVARSASHVELESCLVWHIELAWRELDCWVVTHTIAQSSHAGMLGPSESTASRDPYRSLVVAELLLLALALVVGEFVLFVDWSKEAGEALN